MSWLCWVYVGMWVVAVWRVSRGIERARRKGLDLEAFLRKNRCDVSGKQSKPDSITLRVIQNRDTIVGESDVDHR